MTFKNLQVDTDTLPQAQDLELTPMAPAYRREVWTQLLLLFIPMFMVSWIFHFLPISPPLLATLLSLIPLLVAVIAFLVTFGMLKQASVKGYAVRDHDIAYRHGWIFRKMVLLPFNRVQHIEVASGPLQRRFGLATLKFFTAGGSSVDLKMEGLTAEDANILREHILARGGGEQKA